MYAYSLTNRGSRAVTILQPPAIGAAPHELSMVRLDSIWMSPKLDACCDPFHVVPFRPFELPPGHARVVAVRLRFTNCRGWDSHSSETWGRQPITFRVFGVTRHAQVDLGVTIQVESPPDAACPGRAEYMSRG